MLESYMFLTLGLFEMFSYKSNKYYLLNLDEAILGVKIKATEFLVETQ